MSWEGLGDVGGWEDDLAVCWYVHTQNTTRGSNEQVFATGPELEAPISCMAMEGKAIWVSSGPHVVKYGRGKEVMRISNPLGSNVSFILVFGNQLLALTEDGGRMFVWDTTDGGETYYWIFKFIFIKPLALQANVQFDAGFTATSILHPATYLNKVLVSSSEGSMQLWNIRSQYADIFIPS